MLDAPISKEERSKVRNLSFYLINPKKEEQIKSKTNTIKQINIRAKASETENGKSIEKNQQNQKLVL